jgi:hypothetical protein
MRLSPLKIRVKKVLVSDGFTEATVSIYRPLIYSTLSDTDILNSTAPNIIMLLCTISLAKGDRDRNNTFLFVQTGANRAKGGRRTLQSVPS